jgi:peroxiredoxin
MTLMHTPKVQTSWQATDFELKGVDGKTYTLADIKGENGTVVMFICNHCPYVKGIMDRLPQVMEKLQEDGVGVVAIMSNDVSEYPEDSFENMKLFAEENNFTFPYVIDETQEVARAYDAICTPDFFGFDKGLELKYRGRLDSNNQNPIDEDTDLELLNAMIEVAETGGTVATQAPSMGCSIKWK